MLGVVKAATGTGDMSTTCVTAAQRRDRVETSAAVGRDRISTRHARTAAWSPRSTPIKLCYRRRFFRRSFFETVRRVAVDFPFIFGMEPVAIACENCVPIFMR